MPNPKSREAYEKKREAWSLKEQGLSYTQVAKRLDIQTSEVLHRLYGWGYYTGTNAPREAAGT
jgi:hypothetical protein